VAVFTYKAADAQAMRLSGTIAADTPRQARDALRERGLVVQELEDVRPSGIAPRMFRLHKLRASDAAVTMFVRELSVLLTVGVPLTEALATLASQHRGRGRFGSVILMLRDRVAGGASLAVAMRDMPDVFDELCVSITEVGEDAGTLEFSLDRLAEFRERWQQLRGKLATALIYPLIVVTMALIASLFLMTYVVPQILQPLIEQGQPLPLPTRVVKGASDFILAWWWLIGLIVLLAACGFASVIASPRGRLAWHRFLLRIPFLGDLILKQAIVRVAVVLGTLLRGGVLFVRAVQVAQRTTSNLMLRDALVQCERAIAAGEDIADALRRTGAFPPLVVQLFAVGQSSGKLEEMLDRLASAYDQQVATSSQRLAAVLEPALIIVLAMVVLMIVLATVLPILEAGNAII
jgi:type II secretory pathway component PulF